jgi:hypothetical protein
VIAAPVRRTFRSLSALRGRRIFHPIGCARAAVAEVTDGDHRLSALAGEHDAIVRLSRGVGVHPPLPDILGVAIKLRDAHGAGCHQDLVLASAAAIPVLRHIPLPGIVFEARTYSSIAPYEDSTGRRFLVGAAFADDDVLSLRVASITGGWHEVGTVLLGDELAAEVSDTVRFTPWHTGGGIEPIGWLNRVRRPAYAGSQEGRPDT